MTLTNLDAVIVGGGLAGLCCAQDLEAEGLDWRLLEASGRLGGRVRTDEVDGFLLDRGFQVLLTAYPEARRRLDYPALDLRPLYPGARIRRGGRFRRLADPFRRPGDAVRSFLHREVGATDALAVLRLRWDALARSEEEIFALPDRSTREHLEAEGVSEELLEGFFRPFFGGVFLDPELATSRRMFDFVFHMFAAGETALPAAGMEAIPRQLAGRLPAHRIETGVRVTRTGPGRVETADGRVLEARSVVVAGGPAATADLLGDRGGPAATRSAACVYWAAGRPPVDEAVLLLDGDGEGPVNNLLVPTHAAPEYAPAGQALISAAVVGEASEQTDDDELERAARAQLHGWFGDQVHDWRRLRVVRIPGALPDQRPGSLVPGGRSVHLGDGLFVAGDHREHGSIQGAMKSGGRAAEAVRQRLAAL